MSQENDRTEYLSRCCICGNSDIKTFDSISCIASCQSCGYVFDNPRPSPEEIDGFYSRPIQYDEWLEHLPEREKTWKRRLVGVLRHSVSGSLLDVGAGVGQFLSLAQRIFISVAGTEVSSAAVVIAKKNYGLDLVSGRIETIDFGGRKFDNITLFHVLEHVHDPGETLKRCRNLLNPGGIVFIAVPNEIDSLRRQVRKLLNAVGVKQIRYEGVLGIPKIRLDGSLTEIHLSHFTGRSLANALEKYGFDVVEKGMDPYYVSKGLREVVDMTYFRICFLIKYMTGRNLYDTLWMVGRKR